MPTQYPLVLSNGALRQMTAGDSFPSDIFPASSQLVVPTGAIDGENTVYTLPNAPVGDIVVYLNGVAIPEADYVVSAGTTLTLAYAPQTGDVLTALLNYVSGGGTPPLVSLAYSTPLDIAFTTAPQRRSLTLTGNITFTGSGYGDTREVVVFVNGDSVLRTLAFPSDWKFIGTKPADIAANKVGVLSLQCLGSAATDVRAAWGVQT